MRTGSCSVQQGLTPEAASVVKQAVTLAKRRGHAQVTPLHVANTMLASSNGLLRAACLQSHSHPLQCKALELCFNVALNRLPASNSAAILSPSAAAHYSHCPSISNALVAAFKRAQAHQRRGSIENQQQPLLAVKIELEQLVISILDDPSVSRVMREAGFSSTQVKNNVEQAVSVELCSQKDSDNVNVAKTLVSSTSDPVRSEDVASVMDSLMNPKRRSIVVVGECVVGLEGVVRGVMDKVEKGDVDESMRGVKFISLCRSAFGHVSRVEVENKIEELKSLASSSSHGKGFILYVGDLKWVFENRGRHLSQQGIERGYYYCPVEHMIMEVGKLVSGNGGNNSGRFRVIGIATFQSYMRCKNGNPSLETVWGLHPLTIPAGSLRFSLITDTDSGVQNQPANKKADNGSSWLLLERVEEKQPPCFVESPAMFEPQTRSLPSSACNSDSSTTLPAWLQQCKQENRSKTSNDQNCVPVGGLCKKWNSMCNSPIQKQPCPSDKNPTFSSVSPSSSISGFSSYSPPHHEWGSQRDHPFWISETDNNKPNEPTLRVYIPEHNEPSNPSSNPNFTSSSDVMETEYVSKLKEFNLENLKTLCNALEMKVPWQKDIVPEIASTVLQCRSGMLRRKGKIRNSEAKEETWLFFQGVDVEAKEKISRELASLVFGSHSNNLVSIALSSFSYTRADSTEDYYCRNKRSRDDQSYSYIERFADAVSSNPHRVFVVEDIEQADYFSQLGFKRAMETGRIADSNGKQVGLFDAIIILSCEGFSSRSRACSPPVKQKSSSEEDQKDDSNNNNATMEETSPCGSLDLNISIDDGCDEDRSVDDIGLLESVDRRIIFKFQEL